MSPTNGTFHIERGATWWSMIPTLFLVACSLCCMLIFPRMLGMGPGIALALLVACMAWTIYILVCLGRQCWQPEQAANEGVPWRSKRDALEHYRRTKQALKDLELDYMMGKVSVEDYHELRSQYRTQAVSLLTYLDTQESVFEQILADAKARSRYMEGTSS